MLLNDFRRAPAALRRSLLAAGERVLESGWYVLGDHVAAFERAWAAHCGTRYAVGTGNGLDAIEIGVRTLQLAPGDEIITTPMTAFASVLGIMRAGATPVLADIDPSTGLLDPESAERCIGPRTRAVLLVHLYGQLRNIGRWEELCSRRGLLLLEDAAQAHGAEWSGRRAGGIGRWAAFSFYPTKNLGCFGDGGALCTNDTGSAELASQLRNYGQSDRYRHPVRGLNSRLDELQAAFLQVLLEHLPEANARRRAIAAHYQASIASARVTALAPPESPSSHVYHLFVVCTDDRAALQAHLEKHGVQSLIHYPLCAHQQPPGAALRRDPRGLRSSEAFARRCLSVPCHPYLTGEEVERVVSALNTF
ncbi:MAG: DegT/DnrJ/EryC1/StrS family aminotransferase [Gemmatimonadales bacterium]